MSRILGLDLAALGGARPTLVSMGEFMQFLRSCEYLSAHYWDGPPRAELADAILRRIDFRWDARHLPVRGLSWFEAHAYCNFVYGRLPYEHECEAIRQGEASQSPPEWCEDLFHPDPALHAWVVNPAEPVRRRVVGWEKDVCAAPGFCEHRFAFRVVKYPQDRNSKTR